MTTDIFFFRADVITVSDDEMVSGMRLAAGRMKLLLEASGGAAVAAAIKLKDYVSYNIF